jgi:uncharacterized integral membrane protein (TIGR00698 family)
MIEGLIICLVAALAASWLATVQHVIGAPLLGLFFGILLSNFLPKGMVQRSQKGAAFSSKRILRLGIILAGATLNFKSVVEVGASALPLVIGGIVISFLAAWVFGKLMKVTDKTRLLVGGGTSICGGTAVATLSAVIEAKEEETAYAMTSIFLWDILACLIWPYVAVALHLTPDQYGLLGGVAINDVSSVTAAAQSFNTLMGDAAYNAAGVSGGDLAMIVKLTRVAMLVVVAIVLTVAHQAKVRKETSAQTSGEHSIAKTILGAFPFYVLGFLALAIVNTIVNFKGISLGGTNLNSLISTVYKFFFAMALVGVGYKIKIRDLFTKGVKPILLGGMTWAVVSLVALAYALLLG